MWIIDIVKHNWSVGICQPHNAWPCCQWCQICPNRKDASIMMKYESYAKIHFVTHGDSQWRGKFECDAVAIIMPSRVSFTFFPVLRQNKTIASNRTNPN
jgi:hypothetical protein